MLYSKLAWKKNKYLYINIPQTPRNVETDINVFQVNTIYTKHS